MKLRSRISLFTAASLILISTAWGQDNGREFHWSGKLAADKLVEIKNVNGDIDAEGSSTDEVQVTAEKSGPNAEQVKIEVVPSSEGVTICTMYAGGIFGGSTGPCESGKGWHTNIHGDRTKVHFIVHMPKNLRFAGTSVNGSVIAEDMGREVRADTVNGSIRVSTAAWAQADTVNGSIKARMGAADWTGTLKLDSVNGSIDLEMPDDLNADVKFSSVNGQMRSDFPLTITGNIGPGHSAHGKIGNGGRELVIDTVNGNVELRKAGGI
jgi:Putative adhesin